ncbi:MAG: photosystem II protein Y [Myxacorys chilensis ATA2-1-KO14]|jgi:photosystem II PsbY protein|nr:photosystem II protein Y [Myxacorys chilensis ATA2-1-KO14]
MDWRVLVVLLPVLLAAGWAVSRIAPAAIAQIKGFLDRRQA